MLLSGCRTQGRLPALSLGDRSPAVAEIAGLTFKDGGAVRHNPDRHFRNPDDFPPLPYYRAGDVARYLRPSFMGSRTAVHQAAIGCRYHCEFCGVVTMYNGLTRLQGAARLDRAVTELRDRWGATALQFYDNNFFDREETSLPLLEVLARHAMPWWCYARADTLARFAPSTWELIRKSRLSMAYIGAEAASDAVLRQMKKGSRVEHTYEVARLCHRDGVVPEFSFVLGGPEDPEGRSRRRSTSSSGSKRSPACEVVLYFYTPTPRREARSAHTEEMASACGAGAYGPAGPECRPPEEWTEPRWTS